jgi:hypothetical protein
MENFLFLEKVEDYKNIQEETKKYEAVQIIVEEFMTEDSLFELNLNQEIIQKVLTKMEEKPISNDIFDTSRISIEFLMNDTLMRFSKQRKEDAAKKEALLKNQEERRGSVVNLLGTFMGKKNKEHIFVDNSKRRPSVQVFTKFSLGGKAKEGTPTSSANTSPEMSSPKSTGSTSPNFPSSPTSLSLVKSKKQARGMNSLNFVVPQKLSTFEFKNLEEPEPQELKEIKKESNADQFRNSFSEIVDDLQFDELEKKLEFSGLKHKRRGGIADFENTLKEKEPVEVQTQSYLSMIREHDISQKTEGRPKREKSKKRGIFEPFKVESNYILTERSTSIDSTSSSPLSKPKRELFGIVADMKKRNQSMTDIQSSPKPKNIFLGDVHPKKMKEVTIDSPEYVMSPQSESMNIESLKPMGSNSSLKDSKTMESPSFEIVGNESPISIEDRRPSTERSMKWNLKGFMDNPFDLKRKSSNKDVLPPRESPNALPNLLKNSYQKSKKKLTDLRENQRRSSIFARFQRKNSSTDESLDFISMITSRGKEKKSEDLDFMSMITAREPEKPNNDPLNFLSIISARGKKKNEEPKDNEPVSGFMSILSARGKKKKEEPKEDLDFMSMISSRGKNPDKQPVVEKPVEKDVNPFHKLYEEKKKEENPFHKLYEEKMKEKVKEELMDENPFNKLYEEKKKEKLKESKVDDYPFNKLYEEKKKEKLKDENPFHKLYEEKKVEKQLEVKNPTNVGSVLYPSNEKTVQESNLDLILKRAKQAKESVPKNRRGTTQNEVPFNPSFSMETEVAQVVIETPPTPLESKKHRRGKSEYTVEINESFSMEVKIEEKVDVKSPPVDLDAPNVKKNRRGNSQFSAETSEEEIKPLREPKKNRRGIMDNVVVVENFKMESTVVPLTPKEQEEKECFEIMSGLGLETENKEIVTQEPVPEVKIVKNERKKSRREGKSEFVGFESNFSME